MIRKVHEVDPTVCLLDLPAMGVGVEAIISHRDLSLVGNMGSRSSDELQVVHPLQIFGSLLIAIADPAFIFIEEEAFQRKQRPDKYICPFARRESVFSHC